MQETQIINNGGGRIHLRRENGTYGATEEGKCRRRQTKTEQRDKKEREEREGWGRGEANEERVPTTPNARSYCIL